MKDNQAIDQSNLELLLATCLSLYQRRNSNVSKAIQLFNQARELVKKVAFEEIPLKECFSEILTCLEEAKKTTVDSIGAAEEFGVFLNKLIELMQGNKAQSIDIPSQYAELFRPECLMQTRQLRESFTKATSLIFSEMNLLTGNNLVKSGNWYRGLEVFRGVLEQFSVLEDMDGMARAFIEIGTVQELLGDYELARLSFLDAERLFKKTKREEGIAVAELQLGTLALDHYDYEQARPHLQFASKFFHQHGDQERAKLSDDFLKLADEFERDLALV